MLYPAVKVLITAVLIVLIAEISKRNSFVAAVLASVPLVSVLAMVWLYIDTRDVDAIGKLSAGIFWLVLPSLVLFIALPLFLKMQWHFFVALPVSIFLTVIAYFIMLAALKKFGVEL